MRELYHEGNHIGGIFHFANTLKKFLVEHNYDKIIVFWDAEDNSVSRRVLLEQYKRNRKRSLNEQQQISFEWQM